MIDVNKVVKTFDGFRALDELSLRVPTGAVYGLVGPNGSGKSTIIRHMTGVYRPDSGEVTVDGLPVYENPEVKEKIASIPDELFAFTSDSISDMHRFYKSIYKNFDEARFNALREVFRLDEKQAIRRFSKGMQKQASFWLSLCLRPEILILDEVLAVGDMAFQQKCLDTMRRAAEEEGRTVLYVSHNMNTIRRLCGRCVVLDAGRVIHDGDVEAGIAAYMDHSLGENEVDMSLDGKPRSGHGGSGLRMRRLTLEDKLTPVYAEDEPLRLCLRVDADRRVEDVRLRVTLRTDADVGLGTSWSEPMTLTPGERTVRVSLPLDLIARGVFYASVGLFRTDEIGRPIMLDHITRVFRFERIGPPVWSTSAHGFIRLPTVRPEVE